MHLNFCRKQSTRPVTERPDFDDEKPVIANFDDFDASDLTDLGKEVLAEILPERCEAKSQSNSARVSRSHSGVYTIIDI